MSSITASSGSSGAWARKGRRYSASITLAAPSIAPMSPSVSTTKPSVGAVAAAVEYSSKICCVLRVSALESSHTTFSALRP
ncbi:hypothetical protein [Paracoccus cavernae]|uniref:hypothetical protein n=1 Tax=Paracoccus cavernae TaxID=1571207 RepID=UPI003627EB9E